MMKIKASLISLLLAIPAYADDWAIYMPTSATSLSVCDFDDCSPVASISVKGDSTFNWKVIEQRAAKYAPGAANDQWIAIAKLLWDARQQALAEAKTAK